MNPSQSEQLMKFLNDTLQQGKSFAVATAPEFVRQALAWQFYSAVVWMGVGLFLLLLAVGLAWLIVAVMKEEGLSGDDNILAARGIIVAIGAIIFSCFFFTNLYTMVEVKVAPQVALIELVTNLLHTGGCR